MKRIIVLMLTLVLALMPFATSYAEESDAASKELYSVKYVDLTRLSAVLGISEKTASCSGTAKTMVSTDTIKMTMYLQKQTSTGWSSVASWSTQGKRLVTLDKSKSGLSAGTYRVRLYIAVYDSNGTFVESANAYSKLKTIS